MKFTVSNGRDTIVFEDLPNGNVQVLVNPPDENISEGSLVEQSIAFELAFQPLRLLAMQAEVTWTLIAARAAEEMQRGGPRIIVPEVNAPNPEELLGR